MSGHRESQPIAGFEAVGYVECHLELAVRILLQHIQPAIVQRNDGVPAAPGSGGVRHQHGVPMFSRGLALAVAATAATATTGSLETCYHLLPRCDILTYYRYEHYY